MFSKRNKKIFTMAVMVIVAIGLIGPGALLFFAPQNSGYAESSLSQEAREVPDGLSGGNGSTDLDNATSAAKASQ